MVTETNSQKILYLLSEHFGQEYYGAQIAKALSISEGSVSEVIRTLVKEGLVIAKPLGRMIIYSVNTSNPAVKQFKALNNVLLTSKLIAGITKISSKIILFGSFANGTNTPESDIDIFIATNHKQKVRELLAKITKHKLQPIIMDSGEYLALRANDTLFYDEINKGIVLWEEHEGI